MRAYKNERVSKENSDNDGIRKEKKKQNADCDTKQ